MVFGESSTLKTKLEGCLIVLDFFFKLEINVIVNHDNRMMYYKYFACRGTFSFYGFQ